MTGRAGPEGSDELDALLSAYSPDVAATARALVALVHELLPEAEDLVDSADHLIGFAFPDPRTGRRAWDVLAIMPFRDHVNVQFGNGTELPDPSGLLQGSGKRARHATCRTLSDASRPELRDMIHAQAALRGVLHTADSDR